MLSKVLSSFFENLASLPDPLDPSEESRGLIKRESILVSNVFGYLGGEEDEKWVKQLLLVCMNSGSSGLASREY